MTYSETQESQSSITPEEAINRLKSGNQRFLDKTQLKRDLFEQVKETQHGQYPFAVVLGCIDSRVPAEYVFDVGIGDIFNIRIAGNFVNDDILGSMEFGCKVAGSKVIVVLGHSSCGAIKGAADGVELGNLTGMLSNLKPAIDRVKDDYSDTSSKNSEFIQKVVETNVELTMARIRERSPLLQEMEELGDIKIVGALYDVATGKVDFML